MSRLKQRRSAAARAASRRNGRRSNGPRSPQGRAASAMNSRTHGLFSAASITDGQLLNGAAARLADLLAGLAGQSAEAECIKQIAVEAEVRLEAATELVRAARQKLTAILAIPCPEHGELTVTLRQLVRLAGYQRRFRGQRDRAVRQLLAVVAER